MSAFRSRPAKSSIRSAKSAGRSCPSAARDSVDLTTPVPCARDATFAQSITCSGIGPRPSAPGKILRINALKEMSTPTTRISRSSGAK